MAVPWAEIVRLMPSILELSRELMRRARRLPAIEPPDPDESNAPAIAALEAHVQALEENERRQAELVTNMADQLEQLTTAVTALHRRWRVLVLGQITVGIIALVALVFAVRPGLG